MDQKMRCGQALTDGELTALVKCGSNEGRDKHRLDASRENLITRQITEFFLNRHPKAPFAAA